MRVLVWMLGLGFLLAVSVAAHLLAPLPPGLAEEDAASPAAPASGADYDRLRRRVGEAFDALERAAQRNEARVERAVAELALESFREALGRLEMARGAGSGGAEPAQTAVREQLDLLLTEALDFLLWIPAGGGRILVAENGSPAAGGFPEDAAPHAHLMALAEPFLREGETRTGFERLPMSLRPGPQAVEGVEEYVMPYPCLVTVRPVWARPDAPSGVLVGGVVVDRIVERFREAIAGWPELRFHVVYNWDDGTPRVRWVGASDRELDPRLLEDLEARGTSDGPAFLGESRWQLGRWGAYGSTAGGVVVAWGVTAPPQEVRAALAPSSSTGGPFAGLRSLPQHWLDIIVAGVMVLLGLAVVAFFLRSWARGAMAGEPYVDLSAFAEGPEDRERPDRGDEAPERHAPQEHAPEELREVHQRIDRVSGETRRLLETNLKAYQQDLERSLGEELSGFRSELGELQRTLAESRDELHFLAAREAGGIGGDGQAAGSALTERLDALQESIERLGGRVGAGGDGAPDTGRLEGALEDLRQRLAGLAPAAGTEAPGGPGAGAVEDLRGRLESLDGAVRELARRIPDGPEGPGGPGGSAGDDERVRAEAEGEAARLRAEWEGEVQRLRRELDEARSRSRELERALEAARETAPGTGDSPAGDATGGSERPGGLEELAARASELEAREAAARETAERAASELEAAKARVAELESELESARAASAGEGTRREDVEAVRAELEGERDRLREEAEGLRAEVGRLGAESDERGRRAGELEGSTRELAEERDRLRAETESLRAEADRLREESAARERRTEELEGSTAELRAERDRLQEEQKKLRGAAAALKRRYDQAAQQRERAEELEARTNELDRRIRELEGERDALRRRAEDAEGRVETLESEAAALHERREQDEAGHEKTVEQLRSEVRGVQDFQGALIQGNLPVAMVAFGPELKVFVWNPAAEKLFRQPGTEALGQSFDRVELGSSPLRDRILELARRGMAEGRPRATGRETFTLHGEEAVLRVFVEPVLDGEDRALGAIVGIHEATELAALEREREVQERFQDTVTRSIPVGLIITDRENRVIVWNRHAERILKASEDQAIGRDILEVDSRLKSERFREEFLEAEKNGKPTRFQVACEREDSSSRYLVTFAPLEDAAGGVRGRLLLVERAARPRVPAGGGS